MATEKKPYRIYKNLDLAVTVEAASPREAFDAMLDMDDTTFDVVDCNYEVYEDFGDGNLVNEGEYS